MECIKYPKNDLPTIPTLHNDEAALSHNDLSTVSSSNSVDFQEFTIQLSSHTRNEKEFADTLRSKLYEMYVIQESQISSPEESQGEDEI
jgi:hypothetical protein